MARGRKPKVKPELSEETIQIVEEVKKSKSNFIWDVKIDDPIPYFDFNLSYELTGYIPINDKSGLDFDPDWFTEARQNKIRTGMYCQAPKKTKAYNDFWKSEYARCRDGMTVNGYTVTGDNYFFLNYYQLYNLDTTDKAGSGRTVGFVKFFAKQYEYFHYIELCKRLRKNSIGLKARGVGFSEIAAAIGVNTYNCRRSTTCVYAAQIEKYVSDVLDKCWVQLNYLNDETEGGFRKLRQVHNSSFHKRASVLQDKIEKGWKSQIIGITADQPKKIRGDRCDMLFYEESGSWPNWKKAFTQGDALVSIQGVRFGLKFAWGTGGDSGPNLQGLRDAFYSPEAYDALPCRHNYVENGEYVITGYFIPSYTILNVEGLIDHRGYVDPVKGRAYYDAMRATKLKDPKLLLTYSAEYCYTPEEALSLEGDNKFNSIALSEQLATINIHKIESPYGKIEAGNLEYMFRGPRLPENITGFEWKPNPSGKILILEHPKKGTDGNPFRNLYVAGIDSIDLGSEDTSENTKNPSDLCLVIKRRAHGLEPPCYVAIYKDRPEKIKDGYMTVLKLLQYYNCQAVLESSKTSILTFFRTKNMAHKHLMKRPRALLSDIHNGRSNQYGAPASPKVIEHQLDLIADYVEEHSHNIWFVPMLEELLHYSYANKGRFDIVASMGMCELGDEELTGIVVKEVTPVQDGFPNFGYYTDEKGYKRYGLIPETKQPKMTFNPIPEYSDVNTLRTSDPRYYQ